MALARVAKLIENTKKTKTNSRKKVNMEKVFWQVERIDRDCETENLCATAEEAAEEVLRALKAGFEVQVVKRMYTQEFYDNLPEFQDIGWRPL